MTPPEETLVESPATAARFRQRLPQGFFGTVQNLVRAAAVQANLDGVLTDDPDDVAYLTGFFHHPCERPVATWVGTDGSTILLVPELEYDHAMWQRARAEVVTYPEYPGTTPPLQVLASRIKARRVGFPGSMTYNRQAAAQRALPGRDFIASEIVGDARMVKQPEEIALHAEAARITDLMLAAGVDLVRAGLREGQLPSETELATHVSAVGAQIMYAEHVDVVGGSFLSGGLVYAGQNSVKPHGLPSAYRIQQGDTFMLSLGCAVGGRHVEGERTFILGAPSDEQRRYYTAVRAAQARGAEEIRPGVACGDANAACLQSIRDAGLGQYLRHRQGHGIGIGMHEPPWLEGGDRTPIAPGMVLSNEPGIYIPGHAGYRISDSMLVTEDGSEPLTNFPRSLEDSIIAM